MMSDHLSVTVSIIEWHDNNIIHDIFLVCGRRYKTLSVLKAHRTTYHSQEAFSHVEERTEKKHDNEGGSVMKIRDAKPNGYCDFCLGDDNLNKKTNKPEKLVSCADCGRSGMWVYV